MRAAPIENISFRNIRLWFISGVDIEFFVVVQKRFKVRAFSRLRSLERLIFAREERAFCNKLHKFIRNLSYLQSIFLKLHTLS